MDAVDAELRDTSARLFKLYDALETGKLVLDDLAPRIKELRNRQDELSKVRVQVEAEMAVRNVEQVDSAVVIAYARDLRGLLEEAGFTERKAFLRSFIERIEISEKQGVVHYSLPLPQGKRLKSEVEVLPIDTPGGPNVTFAKPIDTFFELSITSAPSPFGEQNFEYR